MVGKGNSLRSRLLGGDEPVDEQMIEALESRLEESETVVYQLTSPGGLTHERDGETRERGGGDDGTILAATDRKLVFVVDTADSIDIADFSYPDVKEIEESGIVRTNVAITVWWRGTFRFSPRESDTAGDVVEYVSDVSETWQRVVTALKDARQHITPLPEFISDGETIGARQARKAARKKIETATEWASSAREPIQGVVEDRIAEVERDLAHTRAEAYHDRARALSSRGEALADARHYDDAFATLRRSKSHAETALAIAIQQGFEMASTVESRASTIDSQLLRLQELPLDRAERALDRALAVDNPRLAVIAWEQALEHYRDALTAGWGTDASFDGDTDALRMQIEWIVATLVDLRRRLAEHHESAGDKFPAGTGRARTHYEVACDHLAAAEDLASTYSAGEADAIRDYQEWIAGKLT
jgi:tetratricopeptide (TPR) repeat protein